MSDKKKTALEIMEEHGLLGCLDDTGVTSENYKEYLNHSHDDHHYVEINFSKFKEYLEHYQENPNKLRLEDFSYHKKQLLCDLMYMRQKCREPGWNGYDAIPIRPGAFHESLAYLSSLPDSPLPEVIAEPTGKICFHWEVKPGVSYNVLIS